MQRTAISAWALAGALALAGCGSDATPDAPGSVSVTGGWTTATPPGAPTAGGYLTISNAGKQADRLVAASSPLASGAMLHDMDISNGIASMRMVDGMDIPAGKTVTLAPNGFHIMFVTMNQPLKLGDFLPVTLTFQRAGSIDVSLPVLPIGAKGPAAP